MTSQQVGSCPPYCVRCLQRVKKDSLHSRGHQAHHRLAADQKAYMITTLHPDICASLSFVRFAWMRKSSTANYIDLSRSEVLKPVLLSRGLL